MKERAAQCMSFAGSKNYSVYNLIQCMVSRRGNDSQEGVRELRKLLPEVDVFDVVGGLHAWAKTVDNDFPIY